MKNILFYCFIALYFINFSAEAQITGQAKLTHDGSDDAIAGDNHGLVLDVTNTFTLVDVEVWPADIGGDLEIMLINREGIVLQYITVKVPDKKTRNPAPFTVTLNWEIYPDKSYRMIAWSSPELLFDYFSPDDDVVSFPYPIHEVGTVTSGYTNNFKDNNRYYFFYNWTIEY